MLSRFAPIARRRLKLFVVDDSTLGDHFYSETANLSPRNVVRFIGTSFGLRFIFKTLLGGSHTDQELHASSADTSYDTGGLVS